MFRAWKKNDIKKIIKEITTGTKSFDKIRDDFLTPKNIDLETTSKKIIQINNLRKNFYNRHTKKVILDGISLDINNQDVVFILGGNGAGKTTLINCLCGLIKPSQGSIKYLYKYNKTPYEKMGIAFQVNNFIDMFSVWDYLIFTQRLYKSRMSEEHIAMLLIAFGLNELLNVKACRLSGGQQQRLNLILGFIGYPRILIFDELCNNLDQSMKAKILELMKTYLQNFKVTTIIISHDAKEIEALAKRIIILEKGKIAYNEEYSKCASKYKNIYELLNRYQ